MNSSKIVILFPEEVFGSGSALWFSPDGKKLAYAQFNDTNLADFSYYIYGTAGSMDDQYPTTRTIKYPKVCINYWLII